MLNEKSNKDKMIEEGKRRRRRRSSRAVEKKDQIQKWGHNMVMAVRETEIESGE